MEYFRCCTTGKRELSLAPFECIARRGGDGGGGGGLIASRCSMVAAETDREEREGGEDEGEEQLWNMGSAPQQLMSGRSFGSRCSSSSSVSCTAKVAHWKLDCFLLPAFYRSLAAYKETHMPNINDLQLIVRIITAIATNRVPSMISSIGISCTIPWPRATVTRDLRLSGAKRHHTQQLCKSVNNTHAHANPTHTISAYVSLLSSSIHTVTHTHFYRFHSSLSQPHTSGPSFIIVYTFLALIPGPLLRKGCVRAAVGTTHSPATTNHCRAQGDALIPAQARHLRVHVCYGRGMRCSIIYICD